MSWAPDPSVAWISVHDQVPDFFIRAESSARPFTELLAGPRKIERSPPHLVTTGWRNDH